MKTTGLKTTALRVVALAFAGVLGGSLTGFAQPAAVFSALRTGLLGRWAAPDSVETYSGLESYAAPDGREYAIVGTRTGTAFVEVTRPEAPRLVTHRPGRSPAGSGGRSYQTFGHYAYAVADGQGGHSLQVFDLQYLPDSVQLVLDDATRSVSARNCHVADGRLWLTGNWRDSAGLRYRLFSEFALTTPAAPQRRRERNPQLAWNTTCQALVADMDTLFLALDNLGAASWRFVDPVLRNPQPFLGGRPACTYITADAKRRWLLTLQPAANDSALILSQIRRGGPVPTRRPRPFTYFGLPEPTQARTARLRADRRYAVVAYQQAGVQIFDLADTLRPQRVAYFDTYPPPTIPTDYARVGGCQGVDAALPSGLLLATDHAGGLFVLAPPWPWTRPVPTTEPRQPPGSVWPNPATAEVRVALPYAPATLQADVLDALGRRVRGPLRWTRPSAEVRVSLAGLAPGAYWLRLLRPDEPHWLRRVVVE